MQLAEEIPTLAASGDSMESSTESFVVLHVISPDARHDHLATLTREGGIRVVSQPADQTSMQSVLEFMPRVIVIEVNSRHSNGTLALVRRLKDHWLVRHIPTIVYRTGLSADQIEMTAKGGATSLPLDSADGDKLLAAVREALRA